MRFIQTITLCVILACSSRHASGFLDSLDVNPRWNFTNNNASFDTRNLAGKTTVEVIDGQADLSWFANAIEVANLQSALSQSGTFTTFAPTNGAFANLNQKYLKTLLTPPWILHLQELVIFQVTLARALYKNSFSNSMIITMINLENATFTVTKNPYNVEVWSKYTKGSKIISFDLAATNGVVQKVNKVLIPSFYRTNLMQLLSQFKDFSIMVSLIQSVPGLGKIVREGTVTLFAPTNKAWEALGKNKLNALKNNVNALKSLLEYHMLPIVLPTLQFKQNGKYTTYQGKNVTITIPASNSILLNDAKVVTVNALSRNGIGHALDKVLTIP